MENKNSYPILKGQKVLKYFFTCNLIALSLFGPAPSVQANTYVLVQNYSLNLSFKNERLSTVLDEISRQSGIKIAYSNAQIAANSRISIKVKTTNIEEALRIVLGDNYSYKQVEDYISIAKQHAIEEKTVSLIEQQKGSKKILKGLVTDSDGNPIIAGTIMIEGTSRGTITDIDGRYEISAKPGEVVVFSYIGYNTEKAKLKSEKTLNMRLMESSISLSDVVIVGYGRQKKTSIVSAINTVTTKELKVPTRNLTNSLAGQVAGLIAVQRSGEPGYDNSEFWIRGVSSFKGGTNPLVLVDGVPRNMADIEPDEIETFSLLKDAAATAVYGAEGANGVIIITSKRGKVQKPRITFKAEATNITPTRLPSFLGSADFLTLYNEALRNEGKEPVFLQDEIDMYASGIDRDLYPDTDWLDLLRDESWSQRYTINVRGGTERARYFVSGAFYKENGIFKSNPDEIYDTNIGVERYNLRSNVDLDLTKTTLVRVDVSGQYLMTNYPGTGTTDIFKSILLTPPFLMPMKYSDGTLAGHPRPSGTRANPYNKLMESGYAKEWRTGIQSKLDLEQKLDFITKGLSARASLSFDANMFFNSKRTKTPSQFQSTGRDEDNNLIFKEVVQGSDNLSESKSNTGDKKIYFEAAVNYANTYKDHRFGGMLLYMQKEQQYHDNALAFRKQGLVGRATYSFNDRYFIEGNFGYTGSETFAKGFRYGFFPAGGVAWVVSNESFFPEVVRDIMPKFKLRASVGRTGNDNTGGSRFMYRGTLKQDAPGYNIGFNDGGSTNGAGGGIVESQFTAPFLSWEIETKQNYGIDLGLFNNKIDIMFDYFSNNRHNILLQRQTVSNITGFQQMPWQNFGEVSNKGFDGSIVLNQQIGEVKLSARGNVTFARNEIIEYDEVPQKHPWMEVTGTSLNSHRLYIAEGLYTDADFNIAGEGLNKTYTIKEGVVRSSLSGDIRPGDIKYKDLNGDGVIDSSDQMQDVGDPSVPELVYGFGLNAEYKGFYAGIFFQGAGKASTILGGDNAAGFFPFQWGFDETSIRTEALNRWTSENPSQDAMFPRLRTAHHPHNTTASTWWLRDASFLRLKNVEIGYNFEKKMLSKIGIESLRVYLLGNNLAVWDDIKMWDPEIGNANAGFNYPLPRTFTFGLDFTF